MTSGARFAGGTSFAGWFSSDIPSTESLFTELSHLSRRTVKHCQAQFQVIRILMVVLSTCEWIVEFILMSIQLCVRRGVMHSQNFVLTKNCDWGNWFLRTFFADFRDEPLQTTLRVHWAKSWYAGTQPELIFESVSGIPKTLFGGAKNILEETWNASLPSTEFRHFGTQTVWYTSRTLRRDALSWCTRGLAYSEWVRLGKI